MDIGSVEAHLKLNDELTAKINAAVSNVQTRLSDLESSTRSKTDKIEQSFKRLTASLDPVVAGHQRYEQAQKTLDAALSKGLISQDKYNHLLGEAKEKFLGAHHESASFSTAIEGISKLLGFGGKEAGEYGEKIESITGRVGGLTAVLGELGPVLPIVIGVAAAVAGLAVAFEGFEILKEIIAEGMKTQVVYAQLEATLRATGSSANLSSHELIEQAGALALLAGKNKEVVVGAENVLSRFSKIGEETFPRATRAVLDYAQSTGKGLDESGKVIGKVLQGSTVGLRALQSVGVVFAAEQKKALTQLVETGKIAQYQEIIFKALEQAVGGSAEAYGNTLAGGVGKAKFVLSEFKEAVASEIIPALELLTSDLIESLGGWKKVAETVVSWGHIVGDAVRTTVIGAIIAYHQWVLETLDLEIAVADGLKNISGFFLQTAANIANAASHLPKILGGGQAQSQAAAQLSALKQASDITFGAISASARESAQAQVTSLAKATSSLIEHKQALEGTDKVYAHHKDVLDSVSKANAELQHKIESLTEKYAIAAHNAEEKANAEAIGGSVLRQTTEQSAAHLKIVEAVNAIEKLSKAGKLDLIATLTVLSDAELGWNTQSEKNKELLSARIALDHDAVLNALKIAEARTGGTSAIISQEAAEEAYRTAFAKGLEDDKAYIATLTILIAKRKENAKQTDTILAQIKRDLDFKNQLRTAEAKLADALSGTLKASRFVSAQIEIENRVQKEGAQLDFDRIAAITAEVYANQKKITSLEDVAKAAKSLRDVFNEADFQVAVSGISTTDGNLRQIQEQWLSLLGTMGDGSIVEGQRIFDALGKSADDVKAAFQKINDAATIKSFQGAGQSIYDRYKAERDNIERIILESSGKVINIERDGRAKIAELTAQFWDSQLSEWGSALGFLGDHFGGFFKQLQELVNGIQSALKFGQSVSNIASGAGANASAAASLGGIAAVVGIFAVVYDFVGKMIKKAKETKYGNGTDFTIINGVIGTTQLDTGSMKLVDAIKSMVQNLGQALGGAVTDIATIGLKIRNDGKYIAAWVQGQFIGHFESVDDAIKAALSYALTTGQIGISGLANLIKQGLAQWTSPNLDDEMAFLKQLREIGDLASSNATNLTDTVNHLMDLFHALSQVKDVTPDVIQGFVDIGTNIVNAFQAWSDEITGRVKTPDELLFDKQREGALFNAKLALYRAGLQLQELDLQGQAAALRARAALVGAGGGGGGMGGGGLGRGGAGGAGRGEGGGEGGGGGEHGLFAYEITSLSNYVAARAQLVHAELTVNSDYISARGQLVVAEASIYDQQLAAIMAQINAIDQILANLPTEIDIPSIRLPGGGSGSGGADTSARDFRRRLDDIAHSGLPSAEAAFRSLQNQIRDLTEEAQRLHVPVTALAPAIAELTRQFQANLLAQAHALAGIGTDFTSRLQAGLDFFASITQLGRNITGIPDWLRNVLEGRFLDSMRADWQGRVDAFRGLTNPMLEISAQADTLQQDLVALAAATHMSAAQIAAAQAQIAEGVQYQRQSAINSILDRVFADLKGSAQWSAQSLAFEKQKVEINYRLIEFQLRALGAWDAATQALVDAAHQAAIAAIGADTSSNSLSSAANDLSAAASAQQAIIDKWKSALDSWHQYQTSLNTDASLGGVNSREALTNSKSIYEALRNRAMGGDATALAGLGGAAETYRKNLQQFSPSSELLASVLADMRSLNLDSVTPINTDTTAIVSSVNAVSAAINTQTAHWTNHFANQTANDNLTSDRADRTNNQGFDKVANKQMDTTAAVTGLRSDMQALGATILAWRTEARGNSDTLIGIEDDMLTATNKVLNAIGRGGVLAGVGG